MTTRAAAPDGRRTIAIAGALAVQAIGAWCFPSSFDSVPGSIDHQHRRLWSWTDGELARRLREGAHPRAGF